ncbi:MAG: hypothetical protein HXS46_02790 [Theionarchaea archaeon]|nr:hypothetical protein [Theionarchaea archaeon]
MKNIDDIVKLVKADAKNAFSNRADPEFCDLLDYAYEFRKEFIEKRMQAFS